MLVGLLVSIASALPRTPAAAEQRITFDIPAQPLDAALSAYGAATGIQLLFDPALTEGRRAASLKGTFTADAALGQLLAGTGIAARMIGDQGFTLVAMPVKGHARDSGEMSPSVRRFQSYSATLQRAMRNALCRFGETAPGAYRVLAQVWIGPSGATERAELLTSSGDAGRDAMLAASFRGLALGSLPPVDLPQPVTLLITSEDAAGGYCAARQPPGHGHEARR
ncbi:STN domain-containing protein [Bradyrhizobium sp. 2TAF24]|uniref:STN domain-containing protein n=1 Tax=Bradyrhizobium sp. 2TAF24 TaxID=3233011 RepID=UPI003F8ECF15